MKKRLTSIFLAMNIIFFPLVLESSERQSQKRGGNDDVNARAEIVERQKQNLESYPKFGLPVFPPYNDQLISLAAPDPHAGILTNQTQWIRFQARIIPGRELNSQSVKLYFLDKETVDIAEPLCQMHDDGNLEHGDDIYADSVYSCLHSFHEMRAQKMRLVVKAEFDKETALSNVITFEVVEPITEEGATELMQTMHKASVIWRKMRNKYGYSKKARKASVKSIQKIKAVESVGISQDGYTIGIILKSGLEGLVSTTPPGYM